MPAERGRTKKLILALHYFSGGTAGWRCEDCRRQGLEKSRQCGWLRETGVKRKAVWARYGTIADQCPKTAVTADSVAWMEQWAVWRQSGRFPHSDWGAKDLEAMAVLEQAWERMQDEARGPGD